VGAHRDIAPAVGIRPPLARRRADGVVLSDHGFALDHAIVAAQRQDRGGGAAADVDAVDPAASCAQPGQVLRERGIEAPCLARIERGQGVMGGLGNRGVR
jgi:hypothetical protein